MKIMIMTDLEGNSGVDSIEMMDKTHPSNIMACKRLVGDTNTAIRGTFMEEQISYMSGTVIMEVTAI